MNQITTYRWSTLALALSVTVMAPEIGLGQVGNLLGGQVQSIAFDRSDSATVYVGTATGGVFKSTNGGITWASVSTENFSRFVRDLAADPAEPGVLYAATGGLNGGVFKTTDGARTWTRQAVGLASNNVTAVAVDPVSTTTVYAGTTGAGVFKSVDAAASWAPINSGLENLVVRELTVSPSDPLSLYAATAGGVFKSIDGGGSWFAVNAGLSNLDVLAIVISPADDAVVLAGTAGGAFRSPDGGSTWTTVNVGFPRPDISVRHFAIEPTNANIVYAATFSGVFRSPDGGSTWTSANAGLTVLQNSATAGAFHVAIDPAEPTTVFVGTLSGAGVFKSTDRADTWSPANTGLTAVQVSEVAFDPTNAATAYAATTSNAIYKSVDGGASWFEANLGFSTLVTRSLAIDPSAPETIYVGTANRGGGEGVFKSTNGGGAWVRSGFGVASAVQTLVIDRVNTSTLYAGTAGSGVYKSIDGGAIWTSTNTGLGNLNIASLAIHPLVRTTLYAGTAGGVFASLDAGATWAPLNDGLTNTNVHSLAIDPVMPSTVYAGTDGGVFKTVDGGQRWQSSSTGLFSPLIVHAIAVAPTQPSVLYLAKASTGLIFTSTDSGRTWSDVGEGLPVFPTFASSLAITTRTVLVGTDSSGVFRIASSLNAPPIANAGPDQSITCMCREGTTVKLDGRASQDPDGDALSYAWAGAFGQISGTVVDVFLPVGTHVITLTVDDGRGGVDVDTVVVAVRHFTDGVDLDISDFQVGFLFGSEPCPDLPVDVRVTLHVRNGGSADAPRLATIVGRQSVGFGRSVEVYRASLAVSDPVGGGSTAWEFPIFRRTERRAIVWTATILDDHPDADVREIRQFLSGCR